MGLVPLAVSRANEFRPVRRRDIDKWLRVQSRSRKSRRAGGIMLSSSGKSIGDSRID
jgi:hypothetical protein